MARIQDVHRRLATGRSGSTEEFEYCVAAILVPDGEAAAPRMPASRLCAAPIFEEHSAFIMGRDNVEQRRMEAMQGRARWTDDHDVEWRQARFSDFIQPFSDFPLVAFTRL